MYINKTLHEKEEHRGHPFFSDTMKNGTTKILFENEGITPYQQLLTEDELIRFLRIPEITKARDYSYVIENLRRAHDLPCIHLCRKPLYPLKNIMEWVDQQCQKEKSR